MLKNAPEKLIFRWLLVVLFVIIPTNIVLAGSATITWNANTEPDLSGYKIYYGTSQRSGTDPKICGLCGYASNVNVGNVTSYMVNNLTVGQTYYFSVSAYDTSNNESAFSAQVNKFISLTSDFNLDGRVNSVDFGVMMSSWGSTARPAADINKDGAVNAVDLGILLSQWTG